MSRIAYVNGRYVPHAHAVVHIEDRGYQFADGVYEVVYLHDGQLIDTKLHLDRLARSLGELRIAWPIGRQALDTVLREVVARNRRSDGLLYIQVTRGVARREHAFPPPGTRPALVVTLRAAAKLPQNLDGWTGSAITMADQRWARCDIKSIALLPNVLARQAAREQGVSEAILYDAGGMVTEGATTSVWIVAADGALLTRRLSHAILPGCTRAALMEEAQAAGVAVQERAFSLPELRSAREVFLTGASSFLKPILRLDGQNVGNGEVGPVSRRLFELLGRRMGERKVRGFAHEPPPGQAALDRFH